MKLSVTAILTFFILYSCNSSHKKLKSNANELIYNTADTTAGDLSVSLNLTGKIKAAQLAAQIRLSNSGSAPIDFQEMEIATPGGIRSGPVAGFEPFSLPPGKDTTLYVRFKPVNNLKLYQVTGMSGNFKASYKVSVSYKTGSDNLVSMALNSTTEKTEFNTYSKEAKNAVTGYSFDTKTGFNEREKKYLETIMPAVKSPFVYLSEQEIAVSGLNFKLKTYNEPDTVHAEFFIVNHADFPVKVITDSLNVMLNNETDNEEKAIVKIEKISGAQNDINMMEKGDRVLIHFKKFIKTPAAGVDPLILHLRGAFILSGRKDLFNEDLRLQPVLNLR
ncbi:hypothetical protein [Mucilaginibacter gotjawali]|uniref:Uncharacterized protein n=2 Tax=Mucilaginibacter gotjawali TaxID=1550579 RepID=A0A110B2N8_9SPHI|nr:hypothetical protein [Mucilaginibacter gotjawali]MBB3056075.1 hypothetical protein [Mucilaginibacter gotjawali]BAU53588.1 hypothetical protein MgSA37_01757 [Mucilaginibacter gotjawali]